MNEVIHYIFFFSSRRRHTRCYRDWSSDVCSSDLRLVVNTCRDVAQRQRARQHEPLLEDVRAAPERPDTIGLREELHDALAEISPTQAKVVVLKDALDLSFEQVAEVAEIPVGTANAYAHRARERLRAKLERDAAA